ncbi:SIR2 family NAD-dependent protein deacylase [Geodermatophilus obscurus]|uniref:SIR2 family NAD-dependent protein deacylase n=1 Tax=Geodermatophilus obscurus TaxID=1861 RepID=UPI00140F7BE0|nr:SIR2 family protein [Geodermatophilus obscurus]
MGDPWVYEQLRAVRDRHDLILFAGAGLSAQARNQDGQRPPLWRPCIEQMLAWCETEGLIASSHGDEIRELLALGFLPEAAQEIEDAVKPVSVGALQRCLAEVLLYDSAETSLAHRRAARAGFRAFITTNYDDLLETAYVRTQRKVLPKYYEDTLDNVLDSWRSRQPFILKMHGDVSRPGLLVLGNRSYERAIHTNGAFSRVVETLIGASSILFVGYGAGDPNLEGLLTRGALFDGRSKRHWLLAPAASMPALRAKRLWADKGINVVTYKGSHVHVERFFQRLGAPVTSPATLRIPAALVI